MAVPYSDEYRGDLTRAANLLKKRPTLPTTPSLKNFLNLRADAFLSNDYYASDMAWMDLDAPIDITIGPYETYDDELFGYKAAFETFLNLRDDEESTKLSSFRRPPAGDRRQPSDGSRSIATPNWARPRRSGW